MGQSTNDVVPSIMKLCCYKRMEFLENELDMLAKVLKQKAKSYSKSVKLGRTCLQDALPMTFGQQFGAYLSFVNRQLDEIRRIKPMCLNIPLAATAIGTGLGAFKGYVNEIYPIISRELGVRVNPEEDFFDGLQNADAYSKISGLLKSVAMGLSKIATDLRLLCSGPHAGFQEIILPAVQPGSSIMPGKINPAIPELINQICYQVCGNDTAISMAVEGGELELNTMEMLIIKNLFESFDLLTQGTSVFANHCIEGLSINEKKCIIDAEKSLALSTIISLLYGYQEGVLVAKEAAKTGKSVKEIAIEKNLVTPDEADELFDPLLLSDPEKNAAIFTKCFEIKKNRKKK